MAAIELEGLTKDFGSVLAVDDLTVTVEDGEIFGFLGPNGAGKTTTIRTLLGFLSPTSGSARVLGSEVTDEAALIDAKREIGYLPDDVAFDEGVTGKTVLDLHESIKGGERCEELLASFDPPVDRPVRDYSRGNVQKLGIVAAFMHDPHLVILDEPTSGLDPLMKQRFAEFLDAEADRGVTIFFSSHVLGEVRRLCDRVGIIRQGRLVTVEPVESLLDRSGKVVRLRAAEPIPRRVLEIDGVHDLETSGETGDAAGRIDGARAADADGAAEASKRTFTECTFTFTGDVNALLERLSAHRLIDCTIEEAPLEEVFMRFYGGADE